MNKVLSNVIYNLNLDNQRPIDTKIPRDFPKNSIDKVLMQTGPTAFTEAIYDKIRECNDDCGEYVVFSFGVFGDSLTARGNVCPVEQTSLFYKD